MRQIILILIGLSVATQAARFSRDATTQIVTDTQTNLKWQDDSDAKTVSKSWQDAIEYCEALTLGGKDDWRLPNINELFYISDRTINNPALSSVFVNVYSSSYWSSTTDASSGSNAWLVFFTTGDNFNGDKGHVDFVRCVRAGE